MKELSYPSLGFNNSGNNSTSYLTIYWYLALSVIKETTTLGTTWIVKIFKQDTFGIDDRDSNSSTKKSCKTLNSKKRQNYKICLKKKISKNYGIVHSYKTDSIKKLKNRINGYRTWFLNAK